MRALVFIVGALFTIFVVAVRRLFKGALHPGWTFRYEALAEILRKTNHQGVSMPVTAMRRGLVAARIHSKIYPTLRHEHGTLAGLPTETFTPLAWTEAHPTILYLHGGGYIVCSPATHRDLVSRISATTGARCIALNYRKAPEHPFPAPIDDAEAAYRAILDAGVAVDRLFVGGDSAGGGLTLALLLRIRAASLPMPRAAVLLSPWVDLECTGESIRTNASFDYLPPQGLAWAADQYLQGQDKKHPEASAVHADLAGLPPLLIQTGSAELFLSENQRLAARATEHGVTVTHEIEPGFTHVFQAFASYTPECEPAIQRIGAFVRTFGASPV
jgi:epsilon-lactone hydrolase